MICPAERKRAKVAAALEGYSDEAVWAEVERPAAVLPAPQRLSSRRKWRRLLASPDEIGQDKIEGDFYARRWRPAAPLARSGTRSIVSSSSIACAKCFVDRIHAIRTRYE